MKRRTTRLFIKIFIRSFIIVILLLLAGVLSYKAAMLYWQPDREQAEVAYQEDTNTGEIAVTDQEGVSKNLICCYEEETQEITKLVLEVFDSDTNKFTYVTIPVRTQLTLSNTLYQKLILDDPEIPQILKLSTITKYLSGNKAYADEVLIAEELLKTDINYYTVIPKETYDTIFKEKQVQQSDQYDSVPMEVFTSDYKKFLKTLDTQEKLSAYIEELYPQLKSDLSLTDKLSLAENYSQAVLGEVAFELLPGKNLNNAYEMNADLTSQLFEELSGID